MGVKLNVCIPTYERQDCIARVLEEEAALFQKHHVDICIYDSSVHLDTKDLVFKYRSKGYLNVSYRHIDSKVHANSKAYQIFEEAGNSDYDYVWMIHDHTICNSEKALLDILEALEKGYDFYLLHMQSFRTYLHEFQNLEDLLVVGAWPLNSFGACILSTKTFIQGTDWKGLSDKYLKSKTINYSHIGFYYERAAKLQEFKACRLELHREDFLDFLRNEKTSWDKETIRICTECWGNVIMGLPEVYKRKKEALRTQDKWFLANHKLICYKQSGQFGIKSFLKYGKWFFLMNSKSFFQKMVIAVVPFFWSKYVYCHKIIKNMNSAKEKQQKVYIYGAGRHAVECAQFLKEIGMDFEGFIVTSSAGNPKFLLEHPVYEAEMILNRNRAFVIIAILTSGAKEVEKYLDQVKQNNEQLNYMIFDD